MSLIPALLQAIVRIDGDALVMHAGDKPYVISPTEQVDLASRGLTLDAVNGVVAQLLPTDLAHALDEFGAVQHELAPMPEFPGEHFTVAAARGGDDVWVEIRRRRIREDTSVPDEAVASFEPAALPVSEFPADVEAQISDNESANSGALSAGDEIEIEIEVDLDSDEGVVAAPEPM